MATADIETGERILKTAMGLFGDNGYTGARMSDIAAGARVSANTLYKHYEGKKALFLASLERAMNMLLDELLAYFPGQPPDQDSVDAIKGGIESYVGFIRRNPGPTRIIAEAVTASDMDIRREQAESLAQLAGLVGSLFKSDIDSGRVKLAADPDEVAWIFLSFSSLLAYAVLLGLDSRQVGRFNPEYALDLFFRVIRGPARNSSNPAQ